MYNITPNTLFIGKKVHFIEKCASTNALAHELLYKNEAIDGEVVICETQSSGKGQQGNVWESEPKKNLTFSVILTPKFLKIENQFQLNSIISIAICDVLNELMPNKVKIKWPNDILVNQKKICGILIENSLSGKEIKSSIIGIGLNVNQLLFKNDNATSIRIELGKEMYLQEIANLVLQKLEQNYLQLQQGKAPFLQFRYLENLYGLNQKLNYEDNNGIFEGMIKGVDALGRLKVLKQDVEESYNLKEIKFLY